MAWGVFAGTELGLGKKAGGPSMWVHRRGDHAGSPLFCFTHLINL